MQNRTASMMLTFALPLVAAAFGGAVRARDGIGQRDESDATNRMPSTAHRKVLFIGNSQLANYDVPGLVRIIAESAPADRFFRDGQGGALILGRVRFTDARPGLRALMGVAGVTPAKVHSGDCGYRLGPRINAAGRLETATIAYQLLLAERDEVAEEPELDPIEDGEEEQAHPGDDPDDDGYEYDPPEGGDGLLNLHECKNVSLASYLTHFT